MWIQRKLFNKILENLNFDSIGCPKGLQSLGLWGLFFAHLQKKLQWAYKSSFVWIQWKLLKKIGENIYIDLFWPILTYLEPKMARIFGPLGLFSHTPESTHKGPVNQLSWYHIKNFLRKWPKTSTPPPPFFKPIFVIKDPLKKIKAKKSIFYFQNFLGILLCTFKPNIGKIGRKLRDLFDLEKVDGRTDRRTDGLRSARHRISSTDYASSGAKNEVNIWFLCTSYITEGDTKFHII